MIHFGTGGWRAIIGDDFTKANVQLLTFALARKLLDDGQATPGFVIGYDRRFLSEEAAHWAAEVMAGQGIFCRVIRRESPTPLIMFAVAKLGLASGMAVTASHNPAIYNGIKVFMEGGRDADETLTTQFEGYIRTLEGEPIPTVPYAEGLAAGTIAEIDPMNDYVDSILKVVDTDAIRARGLHIVLDPMYGVSKTALQTILLTTRCEVDIIHDRHDTLFGGRLPAPNLKTLAGLINYVEENHCDIGIATDGDADRLGIIDDKAEFLHPNKILVLLYYYLMKYKGWHGAAVRNLATTHLLDRIAESFGESCYEVPVGFKYVSAKMVETGAIIGGESSGGLTVRGHIQGKDGIYAATLLVEMLAKTGRKLSELWQEILTTYGTFEMAEHDLRFTPAQKENVYTLLMTDKQLPALPYEVEKVSYLDGCKIYFKNGGWVIARFSGTEPLLRVFCEMSTLADAEKTSKIFMDFLSV
ncbi:MAG: phosphoglucomutase/phosphomannomutase family protein [Gemmiger sp.]|nr:phosphoglucomutase/phosphomannomutase family protein [Gemmiger sp.]